MNWTSDVSDHGPVTKTYPEGLLYYKQKHMFHSQKQCSLAHNGGHGCLHGVVCLCSFTYAYDSHVELLLMCHVLFGVKIIHKWGNWCENGPDFYPFIFHFLL